MSPVEYGSPWNRACRESLLKASWVQSRRISRSHIRNWKRTRPSAWTNCTGWASFKQMVTVYGPVHLKDESKVLQSRFHIEIPHVMSDPERGRICGLLECLFGRRLPGISSLHSPSEVMLTSTVLSGPIQEISGFRFLCSCTRVLAFGNTRRAPRRWAVLSKSFLWRISRSFKRRKENQYVEGPKKCDGPTGVCAR